MKIALLATMRENCDNQFYYPLGLGYLASYAQRAIKGIQIKIFKRLESLMNYKPDIAGLSSSTVFFDAVVSASYEIKKELGCIIIIGGPHITSLPSSLPESADLGVIGEGEATFLEIIELFLRKKKPGKNDFAEIRGIVYRDGKSLFQTEQRDLISSLDDIPYPVRNWEDYSSLFHWSLTTRGCLFKCSFCSTSKFWGKTRFHSASYVVGELKEIIKKEKSNNHIFADDLFCADVKRIEDIAYLLERNLNFPMRFKVLIRADMLTERLCKSLLRIGVERASLGIESGSDRILAMIKGGKSTVSKNQMALDQLTSYGLKNFSFFMLGIPGETEQDMKDTCNFLEKNMNCGKIDSFRLFPYVAFPGTRAWDHAISSKLINIKKRGFKWASLDIDSDFFDPQRFIYINKSAPKKTFLKYFGIIKEMSYNTNVVFRRKFTSDRLLF